MVKISHLKQKIRTHDPTIYCLEETNLKYNDMGRLKVNV
jgi:hypothetical protein